MEDRQRSGLGWGVFCGKIAILMVKYIKKSIKWEMLPYERRNISNT